ncbi:UNVERIFIED_CONTAM: hypothetical protein GTU68_054064 [Idotea baltica]|nr:hypothetical protein [Idotea baltica]
MTRRQLIEQIFLKKSCLCVGLDTDINRLPKSIQSSIDPIFEFNKSIIDATHDLCVAYKINSAFYEAQGVDGWTSMQRTMDYIPNSCLTILDAKRGDIGNTSDQYAKAAYDVLGADAVTIAPYMGLDSVSSFLAYKEKWSIILALTSNQSSQDFEFLKLSDGRFLFEEVIHKIKCWGTSDQLMMVVGATQTDMLKHIRSISDDYFLLIPGVGAQGGNLSEVLDACWTKDCGMLINSSRGIIYASSDIDYRDAARSEAQKLVDVMALRF